MAEVLSTHLKSHIGQYPLPTLQVLWVGRSVLAQYSGVEHEEPDSRLTFRKVFLESDLKKSKSKSSPSFEVPMAISVDLKDTAY